MGQWMQESRNAPWFRVSSIHMRFSLDSLLSHHWTNTNMPLGFHLAATVCSALSAHDKKNRKLLRLWKLTELVVDDTPSVPVIGVCPFNAGISGQDCKWSEARRQLVEWGASVAGGYKVSFHRHTRDHPAPPTHSRSVVFYLSRKMHPKPVTSRHNKD